MFGPYNHGWMFDGGIGMRVLVDNFQPEMNGRFFRYNGSEIPW